MVKCELSPALHLCQTFSSWIMFRNEGGSWTPLPTEKHRPCACPGPWYGSWPIMTTCSRNFLNVCQGFAPEDADLQQCRCTRLKLWCHDLYLIERTEVEGVIYLISWGIHFIARVLGIYMCSKFYEVRLRKFFYKLFPPHFVCQATWTAREIVAIFISWTTVSLQGKGCWSFMKTFKCRTLPRLLVGRVFSGLRVLEKAAHSFLRRHIGCDIFLPTTR